MIHVKVDGWESGNSFGHQGAVTVVTRHMSTMSTPMWCWHMLTPLLLVQFFRLENHQVKCRLKIGYIPNEIAIYFWDNDQQNHWVKRGTQHFQTHGSLNVSIEHHSTIRYMVYNGYYKVMSNIPKMGQLPTPDQVKCRPLPNNDQLLDLICFFQRSGWKNSRWVHKKPASAKSLARFIASEWWLEPWNVQNNAIKPFNVYIYINIYIYTLFTLQSSRSRTKSSI